MAAELTTNSKTVRQFNWGCLLALSLPVILIAVFAWVAYRTGVEAERHQQEQLAAYAKKAFQAVKSGDHDATIWTAEQIEMLAADPDCVRNVTALDCGMVDLTGPHVVAAAKLVNVQRISVYDCPGTDNLLAAMKGMPSIEELGFDGIRLSDDTIRSFASFPNLKKVSFAFISTAQARLLRKTLPNAKIEIDETDPPEKKKGSRAESSDALLVPHPSH